MCIGWASAKVIVEPLMDAGLVPKQAMAMGLGFHDLVLETSEAGSEAAVDVLDPGKPRAKRGP